MEGKIGLIQGETGSMEGKIGLIQGETGSIEGKIGLIQGITGPTEGKIDLIQGEIGSIDGPRQWTIQCTILANEQDSDGVKLAKGLVDTTPQFNTTQR